MWIAKFKLKDNQDIYSPLCEKYKLEIFAVPYTIFEKNKKINVIVGMILSGTDELNKRFLVDLEKDKRVKNIERQHDFVLVHVQHPISFEAKSEIKRFYNPEYIKVKPIKLTSDGWEHWEVACLDRNELNKLIDSAIKLHHGELFSIKEEKLKSISNLELVPRMTESQLNSVKTAFKQGYYEYPRKLTIPLLAKESKKSYSTFQEHLSKAENKIIAFFLKYR
ncbi:MAG: helix-turn-helix domain-containing protein [Nanoarchaeota archaeon]